MISRLFPWASEFMSFPYERENIGNEAVFLVYMVNSVSLIELDTPI